MIYFKGCVAREKLKNIADATENILKEAGINYQIIEDEPCCGSVLLRTGFVDDALEQMQKTAQLLNGDTILVSCAGCYRTLKKDYKELLDVDLDVIHTSQLFSELIEEKKIIIKPSHQKITYHDPCHLGRHCGEYEASRKVLESLGQLMEMEHNRDKALCCGSGGGVKSAHPEISDSIALNRLKEVDKSGADILSTSCPFCKLNLAENGSVEVLDLSELVLRCIKHE